MGTAIDTSIPTIETTINISISVKPRLCLPLGIGCSIASLIHTGGVDGEYVLPAPSVGLGVVLHAAFPPFPCVGHRIQGNSSQEFYFLVHLVGDLDAFHQDFQRLGIALCPYFELAELSLVGLVLVLIDGCVYFPQRQAQVALLF